MSEMRLIVAGAGGRIAVARLEIGCARGKLVGIARVELALSIGP